MTRSIIFLALLLHSFFQGNSQNVLKPEAGNFLLKNGTLYTMDNGIYVGDLLIKDGIIEAVGTNLKPDFPVTMIDCTNKLIYPGLIDSGTRLGLSEIGSVTLTNDYVEIGDFIPQMKALTAVNPNAVAIPVTRTNGVTTVLTVPNGGRVPGTAALIDLVGYTPAQMFAGYEGVILNFPSSGRRGSWDRRTDEEVTKDAEKALSKLNELWDNMKLFASIDSTQKAQKNPSEKYLPAYKAMIPVLKGQQQLLIEVNKQEDILAALRWVKGKNLNVVLTGVSEGWRVADSIAASKIPVITGPVVALPSRAYDRYDAAYANAHRMTKAGVKVALRTNDIENVRNLPFHAGFAVAYGMSRLEALRAITIHPAEIFGIADKYGSLTKGKVANVVITSADIFEPKSKIEHLFIRGLKVPLENRQTLLYDEFINRDPNH